MPETYRGLAQFAGCALQMDVILYATRGLQSASATQDYQLDKIQDYRGDDVAKRANNEIHNFEFNMKLVGDTDANARALNSVAVGGFLPMLQVITITQPAAGRQMPALFLGKHCVKAGMKIDAKNAACGEMMIPTEKYADATQNDLMTSEPS